MRWKQVVLHPTRAVPLAFLAAILAGTVLLMLPLATAASGGDHPEPGGPTQHPREPRLGV
ncbi:hypothetical protein [Phenylobacterium sp. J367]|uniref:hypothetical protein n=1 Tax=Phenylobacterium sp. J367 TaxID=2898435 RepID=UPI002151E2FF|nr:hypothetical protein [Phenylobacterium sp. J367]MCR5881311.1 hypothetical protein [Phenylobacterium sp. J367]